MEVEGIAELPGDANPLSDNLVLQILQNSLSGQREALVSAKQQLEEWQTKPGYHSTLQRIAADKQNIGHDIRLAAIIQLKNGVGRYWRRGASNAIGDEEKQQIRENLLRMAVNEEDRQMAKLMGVLGAKIARFDFPLKWDNVISQLIEAIRNGLNSRETYWTSPIQLRRSLLLLLYIFKEVSQNRIGSGRSKLKSYSGELLTLLSSVYFGSLSIETIQQELPNRDQWPVLEIRLEDALLSMKLIRRIIVLFIDDIYTNSDVKKVWDESLSVFRSVVDIALSLPQSESEGSLVIQYLRRNLSQIAKFHVSMVREHFSAFVVLQQDYNVIQMHWHLVSVLGQKYAVAAGYPPISQVIGSVNDFDETRKTLVDKLGHQSLLLLRACVKMVTSGRGMRYRTPGEKKADKDASTLLLENVFTEAAVIELINHIVSELLLFQPNDLREWEEEPDEWDRREQFSEEDFDFAVRPCAEKLLLDLMLHFKPTTLPHLLTMLAAVTAPGYSSLLQKEAVYNAIGICSSFINKDLDFKTLLSSNLVPEVQITNPEYKIIRRRIAILVGKWAVFEDSTGCRPIFFQLFEFLLNPSDPFNDQVVRVSAGRQLKYAVDSYECTPQEFLPYIDNIMDRLMFLIEEVDIPDTKVALLNTIDSIVNQMEHHIAPHAERLMATLPVLWDESGDEHLMKQLLLALISHLFNGMKADGVQYHPLVLPIIKEIVTPGSALEDVLLEDALLLWCAVVRQTPTPKPDVEVNRDLLELLHYIPPIMEHDAETFEYGIDILDAYILLAPSVVLSREIFPAILASLHSKLGVQTTAHSGYITKAVEMAWNAGVAIQGQAAVEELTLQMNMTGFFEMLVVGLKGSYEAHQTTGPKAIHTRIQGIIETDYWSLMSRVAYESPEIFVSALQNSSVTNFLPDRVNNPRNLEGFDLVMQWILDEWFSHADDISEPTRKKLVTLALTRLLDLPRPYIVIAQQFQSLMTLWTSVVLELTEGCDDKTVDSLVQSKSGSIVGAGAENGTENEITFESPDFERLQALHERDPVYSVNLLDVIRTCLSEFVSRVGEEAFRNEVLVDVDKEVVDGFAALGIL